MFEVPRNEQGTTRIFTLSMPAVQAQALRDDPERQKALLGVDNLHASGTEVFAISDLGDLGLAGYLREGIDANQADINRDTARLAALEGWVMLVHSSAFGGHAVTLKPAPELTLVGTYAQTREDKPAVELQSDAAQPYTGTGAEPVEQTPAQRSSGSLVVAVLAVIGIAILWFLLT